jgi:hypothetical protein
MAEKPRHADGYTPAQVELARKTCRYVATILGEMMDEVVIAGGLVPSLLIDQESLPPGTMAHVGTQDLDVGFQLALLNNERYKAVAEVLRDQKFAPFVKSSGTKMRQTWTSTEAHTVSIDFLIPRSPAHDKASRIHDLEGDFAAFIIPGLHLAFRNPRRVPIPGYDCKDRWSERTVNVCGPGAFVVLKALAHFGRDEPKDAYDLYYLLQYYGNDVGDVADDLRPLLDDQDALQAMANLRAEYTRLDAVGPSRLAEFLHGRVADDEIRADFVGRVGDLLRALNQA